MSKNLDHNPGKERQIRSRFEKHDYNQLRQENYSVNLTTKPRKQKKNHAPRLIRQNPSLSSLVAFSSTNTHPCCSKFIRVLCLMHNPVFAQKQHQQLWNWTMLNKTIIIHLGTFAWELNINPKRIVISRPCYQVKLTCTNSTNAIRVEWW